MARWELMVARGQVVITGSIMLVVIVSQGRRVATVVVVVLVVVPVVVRVGIGTGVVRGLALTVVRR